MIALCLALVAIVLIFVGSGCAMMSLLKIGCVSIMFSHVYHVSVSCAELAKTVCTRLSFPPPHLISKREPGDEARLLQALEIF